MSDKTIAIPFRCYENDNDRNIILKVFDVSASLKVASLHHQ